MDVERYRVGHESDSGGSERERERERDDDEVGRVNK